MHQPTEFEGKGPDGKDKDSSKKSKGTPANTCAKAGESGKAGSGSGNDGFSQRFSKPLVNLRSFRDFPLQISFLIWISISLNSAESGSEGSSNASDENTNQQVYDIPSLHALSLAFSNLLLYSRQKSELNWLNYKLIDQFSVLIFCMMNSIFVGIG